jgi:hypothetical protein
MLVFSEPLVNSSSKTRPVGAPRLDGASGTTPLVAVVGSGEVVVVDGDGEVVINGGDEDRGAVGGGEVSTGRAEATICPTAPGTGMT